jgi:hypothetical protein
MNNTQRNRIVITLKIPSQYAQGQWVEFLSPTQILTGQLNSKNNMEPQQHQHQKTKKSHGYRKEQQRNSDTNPMDQDIIRHSSDNNNVQDEPIQV